MSANHLSDAKILEKLNANPFLKERIGSLLLAVEDESGNLREADAAEMRIIDEMRQMGQESLAAWARPSPQDRPGSQPGGPGVARG